MDSAETNPNSVNFYIGYILILTIIYASIMLIQNFLKNRNEEIDKNVTMDYYGARGTQIILDRLTPEQSRKRFQYLFVSVLVKAATWVKAPYLYALYNRIHGFNRSEIGYLMAVDNISALIFGPILGGLSDIYGRKKFCILYCLAVITHICLRITGVRELAWFAQIFTGVCSCLLDSAFESWINFEAEYLFFNVSDEDRLKMKNSFLREIFTKQITLDCFCSIVLTGLATILYAKYNIFYPFYACIIFAAIAALAIGMLWDENQMWRLNENKRGVEKQKKTFCEQIKSSWIEIRHNCPLLCVGGIESCFKISLALFLFIWTPLLEETIGSYIHPGAIFACFMLARLIGSEVFEVKIDLIIYKIGV
jgi:MFS family permease